MPLPSISFAITPRIDRDQDPFEVEAEDRAPGGVALEDHLLAGAEVEAHGAQHMPPDARQARPGPSPRRHTLDRMAILRVEPLTTARALRGPFDYRRPEAMEDARGRQRRPRPLRAAPAARRRRRARRGLRAAAGAAGRADRGARGRRPAGAGPARALGRPRVLLDPLARPAAGAAAGHRDRRGGRTVRAKTELRAEILPAGEAALERRRAARRQAAGGAGGAARRRDVGGGAGDRGRLRPPDPAPAGGARPDRDPQLAPAPRPRRARASAPPPSAPSCCPSSRPRSRRSSPPSTARPAPPRQLLLHGVTGSGKTEVYLAAVEAALERGRGAIVLVPEIGLAPQAVARFRARLGDRFAVLHSALSAGERYDEWRRLRSGEASVCVGPRSAVFAPVRDLGLIVIDEEHDPSYKQEGDPTYDARAVARRRAEDCGAVLVAGTATPRPETWLELPRLELPRRVDGLRMPPVAAGRHARGRPALGPAARRDLGGAGGRPRRRRQGDRDDQPPRLRPLAHLPLLRPPLELPQLRRLADRPPPQRPPRLPPLRPRRARSRAPARSAPRRRSRGPAPAPSGSRRCCAERLAPMPVFRLDSDTAAERGAHARILAALRRGRRAPSSSAPRWSPRATTSPR